MNISASSLLDTIQNNGYKYTKAYTKNVLEADDDVEAFQEKFDEFRKIIRRLSNYSSDDTTEDKLKDYLSDLADTYNSMSEKEENITDSNLKKYLDKLDTLIDDNAKSLKKLGLKKNDDGELEFDEDTFDDDYDQKIVNKLFTGTDSFIDQARKLMRNIDYSASDAQIVKTERHLSSATKYESSDILKAYKYETAISWGQVLNDVYKKCKENSANYSSYLTEDDIKTFISCVNDLSGDSDILTLCENNKDKLKALNINYSSGDKGEFKLEYDTNSGTTSTTPLDNAACDALFNSSADSFVSKLISLSKEGFNNTIKVSEIGVDISDYSILVDEKV